MQGIDRDGEWPSRRRFVLGCSAAIGGSMGLGTMHAARPTDTRLGAGETQRSTLGSVRTDEDLWDPGQETFSGDGNDVADITLEADFTVFSFSHAGDGHFAIEVLDADGELVELAVNEIGEVDGVSGVGIEADEYLLDISANGEWDLGVAQPVPPAEHLHEPPADAEGPTSDVVGLIELNGGETVFGRHEGESNFIVKAWDENATSFFDSALWKNEIGEYEGEVVNRFAGVAWVAVQADGEWLLEID